MDYVCGQKTENVFFLKTLIYKNNTYFVAFSLSSHSPFLTKYPKTYPRNKQLVFVFASVISRWQL